MKKRRKRGTGGLEFRGKYWYFRYRNEEGKTVGECLKTADKEEADALVRLRMIKMEEARSRRRFQIEDETEDEESSALAMKQKRIDELPDGPEKEALVQEIVDRLMEVGGQVERVKGEREQEELAAEEMLRRRREEVDAVQREMRELDKTNPTPESFIAKYEANCRSRHLQERTVQQYLEVWKYFTAFAQPQRIRDITEDDANRFIQSISSLSPSTVSLRLTLMKALMKWAIAQGYYPGDNSFAKITPPKVTKKAPKFLSRDEVEHLLAVAKNEHIPTYLFIAIGVHAGLRKAEIVNLRWEDIDFKNNLINVACKGEDKKKDIQRFRTKTGNDRVVPLKEVLKEILEPHRQDEGYVVQSANDARVKRSNWYPHAYYPTIRKAGVPHCNPHTLRHTFASLAAQSGSVDLYQIQKWLGHASIEMTQVYAHLLPYSKNINNF